MLVSVQNVSKMFLDDAVLSNVSLEVREGDRIGLLGINGAGKTTLMNIISGSISADTGVVQRAKNLRVGYLRQNDALEGSLTLAQEARSALARAYAVGEQLQSCGAALAANPKDAVLLAEYDRLSASFDALDGYHVDEKIDKVLNGLGFAAFDRAVSVATLSGGEKMRFAFAKVLLQQPDLLLLDEPTNHLDFTMLEWLESYLNSYKGAVLVVSHDRYFLDAVARDICELECRALTRYKGGYSSFVAQKAERRKAAMREWEKQQEEIAAMEDYVRRNIARASTAGGARGRVKALEKMERLQRPPAEAKGISLRFDFDVEPFQSILDCEGLSVSVGQAAAARELYSGVDLKVERGEKIAIIGLNGVGKSTFLKSIQNLVSHEGRARWGGNTRIGYFDQELAGLPMDSVVLEAVHSRYPVKTEFEIRSALGRLLLEGEAVYKKVRELSGAQRAKVAFAILQMQRANVLLLDEPTNHLDYRAKEVLESSLLEFAGTLIVVSHDRYFLRRVPEAILEMRADGFVRYNGNYDDYLETKRETDALRALTPTVPKPKGGQDAQEKQTAYRGRQQRARDAQRRQRIGEMESRIEELEAQIDEHTAALGAQDGAVDYGELARHSAQLEQAHKEMETAMREWLQATGE